MAVHATATFYTGSPGPLADGTRYGQAGHFCAAPGRIPLGARLLITETKSGRRLVATVRDRGRFSPRNLDLPSRSFRALAGPRYRVIGRIRITYRVLSVPHAGRHHSQGH
jgi:rare lipoprotein A (peptidoglycan hydrolase)